MQTVLETRSKLIWCVGRSVLDVLLPPQCLACDTSVDQPGSLCAACFSQFTFITRPYCNLYCLPFESAVIEDEVMCGACMKDHPSVNYVFLTVPPIPDSQKLSHLLVGFCLVLFPSVRHNLGAWDGYRDG